MGFVGKVMDGSGVEIYSILGVFIFVSLFIIILIRTVRMKKKDLIDFKTGILEDAEIPENNRNF